MIKKYPSQIRYEEKNPSITFRVTKQEKEKIEQMAKETKKSISELVRIALFKLDGEFTLALNNKETERYQKAKAQYEITFPCSVCGLACSIPPNSDCHNAVIQFLREKRWGHSGCYNKI